MHSYQLKELIMEYDTEQITIRMIKKFVDLNDKIVLEIGCGEGKTSSLLADDTKKYIGIDTDGPSINNAISKFKNVDFKIGNGESLEFENSFFDIVLFTLSLHHQNSRIALKEAGRVLKDKGKVLILEPSIDGELQHFFHLFDDETSEINEALDNIMKSTLILEQQETFNAITTFNSLSEICNYPFDREKVNPGDADRIIEKLNQLQIISADHQPIHLNDTINIYCLAKEL